MPNLVLIGEVVGTGVPKLENLVNIAVFQDFLSVFRPEYATIYTDQREIWHCTTNQWSTSLCRNWPWYGNGVGTGT